MTWIPRFKIGPLNQELEIPCQVVDYSVDESNIEVEQRNLSGASLKSYLRQNVPTIRLSLSLLPDAYASILRGFQSPLAPLNFIFNASLATKYLQATSASTTSIVIPPTSATGVAILGVYLASDYLQGGTNYYSIGSTFDQNTGTITLATALPGTNTDVLVNYTFNGVACWAKVSLTPHRGIYSGYWQGTLNLTGA